MLSKEQQLAVDAFGPRTVVLAGAGSGKTRVLVAGLVALLQRWPAEQILLVTFTRRAASEMSQRASAATPRDIHGLYAGTFHAIAARCLHEAGQQFRVIDENTASEMVERLGQAISQARCEEELPTPAPADVLALFSAAAGAGVALDEYLDQSEMLSTNITDRRGWLEAVWHGYQQSKRDQGWRDYADLVADLTSLVVGGGGPCFAALLVDEAQDLDRAQRRLLDAWQARGAWCIAVGDPNQSIYSWRGADYQAFLDRAASSRCVTLATNYRSTPEIVATSLAVIAETELIIPARATRASGAQTQLVWVDNEASERAWALEWLDRHRQQRAAVLCRTHQPLEQLARDCAAAGLPVTLVGDQRLERVVQWMSNILRLPGDPYDQLGLQSLATLISESEDPTALVSSWQQAGDPLQAASRASERIAAICQLLDEPSTGVWQRLLLGPLQPLIVQTEDSGLPMLEALLCRGEHSQRGEAFLQGLAEAPLSDRPQLATIHSAKGLEWSAVLVLRVGPGSLPSYSARSAEQLAEERRLLYVAITRAQDTLTLLGPRWLMQTSGGFLAEPLVRQTLKETSKETSENTQEENSAAE
jgi:DNA helicase-2/ATP-dependent DNA helicase PcrA